MRSILVDTSTDLRAQALAHDVRRVDAILFTHSHADHVLGLDEVRRFNHLQQAAIPCFADERTLSDLRRTFAYIFAPPTAQGGGIPQLSLFRIAGPFSLGGVEIVPVPLLHGRRPILGFRLGVVCLPHRLQRDPGRVVAAARRACASLILDALRDRPHPTHFSVVEALDVVARLGARAHLLHAHLPRPAARRDLRAPARRRGAGL